MTTSPSPTLRPPVGGGIYITRKCARCKLTGKFHVHRLVQYYGRLAVGVCPKCNHKARLRLTYVERVKLLVQGSYTDALH